MIEQFLSLNVLNVNNSVSLSFWVVTILVYVQETSITIFWMRVKLFRNTLWWYHWDTHASTIWFFIYKDLLRIYQQSCKRIHPRAIFRINNRCVIYLQRCHIYQPYQYRKRQTSREYLYQYVFFFISNNIPGNKSTLAIFI